MKKIILLLIIVFQSNANSNQAIINEVAEQYVRLVLALGVHDEAYVDAYYGPKDWQEAATKNKIDLKTIIRVAEALQSVIREEVKARDITEQTEMQVLRHAYLGAQINSLSARAKMLTGEADFDFDQQSKALYDTQPPKNSFEQFEIILKEVDDLLPGDESLSKRAEKFQAQFIIPQDKLRVVFDAAIKACRERTQNFVELLEKENFSLEFVSDKPWSGYNWYKGDGYSLIQVNTELPIYISRAVDLGCHEGYPGHHTYNSLLEANLYIKQGWVEYSVYPLFSPQSLIAEGTANYGIEMAFPGEQKTQFEKKVLYPLAGLDVNLAERYNQFLKLTSKLNYAGNEVARLYLNKDIDANKASELMQKYTLMSDKKAHQRIRFIDTYGAYVINYNWGKDLVKQWVEAGTDKSHKGQWKRFAQLLSSPRLPSTLN